MVKHRIMGENNQPNKKRIHANGVIYKEAMNKISREGNVGNQLYLCIENAFIVVWRHIFATGSGSLFPGE
jgi:hypothetical protein